VLAFKAFNPNISAESDYLPLVATAGVLFLEADHITQPYLHDHYFASLMNLLLFHVGVIF